MGKMKEATTSIWFQRLNRSCRRKENLTRHGIVCDKPSGYLLSIEAMVEKHIYQSEKFCREHVNRMALQILYHCMDGRGFIDLNIQPRNFYWQLPKQVSSSTSAHQHQADAETSEGDVLSIWETTAQNEQSTACEGEQTEEQNQTLEWNQFGKQNQRIEEGELIEDPTDANRELSTQRRSHLRRRLDPSSHTVALRVFSRKVILEPYDILHSPAQIYVDFLVETPDIPVNHFLREAERALVLFVSIQSPLTEQAVRASIYLVHRLSALMSDHHLILTSAGRRRFDPQSEETKKMVEFDSLFHEQTLGFQQWIPQELENDQVGYLLTPPGDASTYALLRLEACRSIC